MSHSRFKIRATLATLSGVALVGILTFRAQGDQWDKKTVLTVDQPIQVTDTLLQPGRYVLKLADIGSSRHVVQIFNGDQTHIINTVMAIPNYRLQPTDKSQFMFWETPPGTAKALRAWFYPGDNFGQEFRYPKEPAVIETAQVIAAPPPAPAPAPAVQPPPAPIAPQAPAPQAVNPPPREERPVEVAQNNTPAPPPPEAQPAPREEQLPATLPKTASPYPLLGLGGVFSLALYGLLRLARLA